MPSRPPVTSSGGRPRYPDQSRRRLALAPGVLGALAVIWAAALLGAAFADILLYLVAALALICAWFAFKGRAWWWLPPLLAIAVLWNPVWPFGFSGTIWVGAHYLAAVVFIATGLTVRVDVDAEDAGRGGASNGARGRGSAPRR